jgi:hypothetical protein
LGDQFTPDELAMGIYGQLNSYVMVRLLVPDCPLNRATAKQIVRLFLQGAAGERQEAWPRSKKLKLSDRKKI